MMTAAPDRRISVGEANRSDMLSLCFSVLDNSGRSAKMKGIDISQNLPTMDAENRRIRSISPYLFSKGLTGASIFKKSFLKMRIR